SRKASSEHIEQEPLSGGVIIGFGGIYADFEVKLCEENSTVAFCRRNRGWYGGGGLSWPPDFLCISHRWSFQRRESHSTREGVPADQPFRVDSGQNGVNRFIDEHARKAAGLTDLQITQLRPVP